MVQRSKLAIGALAMMGLLVAGAPAAHATGGGSGGGADGGGSGQPPPGPVVVVKHLNNPRQLNWDSSGETLIIAEAGRGGDECTSVPPPPEAPPGTPPFEECMGATGSIATVTQPWKVRDSEPNRVVEGFLSTSGPDGSFAGGSHGADALEAAHPGEYIVAGSDAEQFAAGGPPAAAAMLFGADGGPDGDFIISLVDLSKVETELNPDGAQIEANPYAVLFIDPTPDVADNDGYALVADAAANTVWKITPDYMFEGPPECSLEEPPPEFDFRNCLKLDVSVFVTYPTTPESSPDQPAEFVPTALTTDGWGNIFVGGLGSLEPGAGAVVKYDHAGNEIMRWTGLTSVTGIAVTGDHVYASQLFGTPPPFSPFDPPPEPTGAPGSVVRLDRWNPNGAHVELDVPFPAGLTVDGHGNVYAAVNSVAPAEGIEGGPQGPPLDGGAVWKLDFTSARPFEPLPLPWFLPPADTGGEWVPLPPNAHEPIITQACASTVFVTPGDVLDAEYMSTHNPDGTVRVDYRGAVTVDVLRAPDGKFLDELDVSGPGYELVSADRLTVTFSYAGPSLIAAFDAVEAATLAAAGLPALVYYTSGTLTETVVFPSEPGPESTIVSAEIIENTVGGVSDVCALLDQSPVTMPVPELPGPPPGTPEVPPGAEPPAPPAA